MKNVQTITILKQILKFKLASNKQQIQKIKILEQKNICIVIKTQNSPDVLKLNDTDRG
jgi:hypothetical protein